MCLPIRMVTKLVSVPITQTGMPNLLIDVEVSGKI
jgi:hypothetical protein